MDPFVAQKTARREELQQQGRSAVMACCSHRVTARSREKSLLRQGESRIRCQDGPPTVSMVFEGAR